MIPCLHIMLQVQSEIENVIDPKLKSMSSFSATYKIHLSDHDLIQDSCKRRRTAEARTTTATIQQNTWMFTYKYNYINIIMNCIR